MAQKPPHGSRRFPCGATPRGTEQLCRQLRRPPGQPQTQQQHSNIRYSRIAAVAQQSCRTVSRCHGGRTEAEKSPAHRKKQHQQANAPDAEPAQKHCAKLQRPHRKPRPESRRKSCAFGAFCVPDCQLLAQCRAAAPTWFYASAPWFAAAAARAAAVPSEPPSSAVCPQGRHCTAQQTSQQQSNRQHHITALPCYLSTRQQ